jgi:hypothetical protein
MIYNVIYMHINTLVLQLFLMLPSRFSSSACATWTIELIFRSMLKIIVFISSVQLVFWTLTHSLCELSSFPLSSGKRNDECLV